MPIYVFACIECDQHREEWVPMFYKGAPPCEKCGEVMIRDYANSKFGVGRVDGAGGSPARGS